MRFNKLEHNTLQQQAIQSQQGSQQGERYSMIRWQDSEVMQVPKMGGCFRPCAHQRSSSFSTVPPPLSDAAPQTPGMNKRMEQLTDERQDGLVAEFGEARLTREQGRLHLRGGSMTDRMEALEWVAMFLPDEAPCVRR